MRVTYLFIISTYLDLVDSWSSSFL